MLDLEKAEQPLLHPRAPPHGKAQKGTTESEWVAGESS